MEPFIANTDREWFDFLALRSTAGRVDEAVFWSPKTTRPLKNMPPGTPVFLRLKGPDFAIAGYGFYAHFLKLSLETAWAMFGWKNGVAYEEMLFQKIGVYRGRNLLDPAERVAEMGCTILRDVRLWPREQWIGWKRDAGWKGSQRGATERDPARIALLLATIRDDAVHRDVESELAGDYRILAGDVDERTTRLAETVVREGQGTFRARLLGAYEGRCAISGEHTEPVLDAAHIQPYCSPRSNHVQNGLLLTKEFHTLFDRGYVGVTADYHVRVSPLIRDRWNNGKRYYAYDGAELLKVPARAIDQPSRDALAHHLVNRFKAG